jgi:predicted RNA-binding Zn-ribbon protein involved in translation (DUF1610 family)
MCRLGAYSTSGDSMSPDTDQVRADGKPTTWLYSVLQSRPLLSVGGLVILILGGVLAAQSDWKAAIPGNILIVLGGVFISSAVTSELEVRRAQRERAAELQQLRERLQPLSRQLGVASRDINQALSARLEGQYSEETLAYALQQSLSGLYGVMGELEMLARSADTDADAHLAKVELLTNWASKLGDLSHVTDPEARKQLQALKTEVESAATDAQLRLGQSKVVQPCPWCGEQVEMQVDPAPGSTHPMTCPHCLKKFNAHRAGDGSVFTRRMGLALAAGFGPRVHEEVVCPICKETTSTLLGTMYGASAFTTCTSCGSIFHANRDREGRIFTVLPGESGGKPVRLASFACPECRTVMNVKFADGEHSAIRYCFKDRLKLLVSDTPEGDAVVTSHEPATCMNAEAEVAPDGTRLLVCPICDARLKAFYTDGSNHYAACYRDDAVLFADQSAFGQERLSLDGENGEHEVNLEPAIGETG